MEGTKKLYEYRGVMDSYGGVMNDTYHWELEDMLFKHFKLKEDSDSFWEIYPTGYEEFYLENREILKNANLVDYVNRLIAPKHRESIIYPDYSTMTREEIDKFNDSIYEVPEVPMYIVTGFIYLKYQLDIPKLLKEQIIKIINSEIHNQKQYKEKAEAWLHRSYDCSVEHLNYFKNCIEKEDGEGLMNIEITLPKRTIYE